MGISDSEGPVLIVYQKTDALNLGNDTIHNAQMKVKLFQQKGILHDKQQLPMALRLMKRWWAGGEDCGEKWVYFVIVISFLFVFMFVLITFLFAFYFLFLSYFYNVIFSFSLSGHYRNKQWRGRN